MQEVLTGVFHWQAVHPKIGVEVDSYWLEGGGAQGAQGGGTGTAGTQDGGVQGGGVLIDPLIPLDAGLQWFAQRPSPPSAILLSNRHHYRDSARFAERFHCPVLCSQKGLHEFSSGERVQGFAFRDRLPGGVIAHEVDAICPDETALYIPASRALVIADGVVLGGPHGEEGLIGFVPDSLMDDPQRTKEGLLSAFSRLLEELDFQHLLLAHGGPLIADGRRQLEDLIAVGGRTAFEM